MPPASAGGEPAPGLAMLVGRYPHFSPVCHAPVILLAQSLRHFVGGPHHREELTMTIDEQKCMCYAREYLRLAGQTSHQNVRDQLLDLARGWTAVAQSERRSDDARVLTFTRPPRSRAQPLRSARGPQPSP
jgi:hypothetical protein